MDDENCGNYEVNKNCNICNHFVGNIWSRDDVIRCSQHCSLVLLKSNNEIDVKRCNL